MEKIERMSDREKYEKSIQGDREEYEKSVQKMNDIECFRNTINHLEYDEFIEYYNDVFVNNPCYAEISCRYYGDMYAFIVGNYDESTMDYMRNILIDRFDEISSEYYKQAIEDIDLMDKDLVEHIIEIYDDEDADIEIFWEYLPDSANMYIRLEEGNEDDIINYFRERLETLNK